MSRSAVFDATLKSIGVKRDAVEVKLVISGVDGGLVQELAELIDKDVDVTIADRAPQMKLSFAATGGEKVE